MGWQIEKSLLAPTFYTDWLDRTFKTVYICAVVCFAAFFLHVGGGVDMVSLKRVLVPTVRSFFPHIVVLTSCSRLATF